MYSATVYTCYVFAPGSRASEFVIVSAKGLVVIPLLVSTGTAYGGGDGTGAAYGGGDGGLGKGGGVISGGTAVRGSNLT